MAAIILQDASGPFLYGTLNRRPQMTLPRPRSDRLGSEGSSIMNGHHHHHHLMGEAHLTTSISAYNTQDVWTPIQTHRYVVRIIPLQLRLVKFLWIFLLCKERESVLICRCWDLETIEWRGIKFFLLSICRQKNIVSW